MNDGGKFTPMDFLEGLVMSGRIVDLMLIFLLIETLVMAWRNHRTHRDPGLLILLANAGAGGSLMLALKAVLTDAGLGWIIAAILSSLVFHTTDLALRWRKAIVSEATS